MTAAHEPELTFVVATDRIPTSGMTAQVTADARQCAAVAARLKLPSVSRLSCDFALTRPLAGAARRREGEIVAVGRLRATLTRECVVSLDPFEIDVEEGFRVRFVPAGSEFDDADPESDDEIPYEGAGIDLGEAMVEQLALVLDPYPRKPGAALPDEAGDGFEGPFAALTRLRRAD